jgi:hypothetical protein
VKNRFQSLPFKCNLQRYTGGMLSELSRALAGANSAAKAGDGGGESGSGSLLPVAGEAARAFAAAAGQCNMTSVVDPHSL